ncbi:MAG: 30S ribosomal protein S19 [Candidatus ainarchaeum sp.]|nr:30S ribosomal protein S19 [Candidatus ainarchaeum sp.]MDD3975749.1 30S ribosomal protein S19 [Candidatus ainarchaeum sp.]
MEEPNDFLYKGKSLDDLKKLSLKEFASLVNSRARRNIIRNESDQFYQRVEKDIKQNNIRTHRRDLIVTPKMVGKTISIYNGKEFKPVFIVSEMLGHYLGEFVLTRKRLIHGKAGIGATKSSTAISERK